MEKKSQILHLFSTLDSQQSTNRLVETCYKIALSFLRYQHRKVQNIISREEGSLEDLAIDSIASLFEKENTGSDYVVIAAFKSWQPEIKTEEDALLFLNKIISKRVEQHISMLLRESDPVFSKILDSVNYLIKKHNFVKRSYMGRTYILPDDKQEITGKVMPVEEFESIPSEFFADAGNILMNIITYINAATVYTSAIPLNALILRLKNLNVNLFDISENTSGVSSILEAKSIVKQALCETFAKLQNSYIIKGKLSASEGESITKALNDMAIDLQDGGLNPGLYKYLSLHFPELNEEVYNSKYHNILEYLLKT